MKLFRRIQRRRIWGRNHTPYMDRFYLWRNYRLQLFHRGDEDPDPHDHPYEFWTFPLVSYVEEVWTKRGYHWSQEIRIVKAFRWHHRDLNFKHRVLRRHSRGWLLGDKILTLVKVSQDEQEWGFWVEADPEKRLSPRVWVPWREYLGES